MLLPLRTLMVAGVHTGPVATAVRVLALSVFGLVWVLAGATLADDQGLIAGELTVGFSERSFAGVNLNDAEAAFKAFLVSVGRQRGYDLVAGTRVLYMLFGCDVYLCITRLTGVTGCLQ